MVRRIAESGPQSAFLPIPDPMGPVEAVRQSSERMLRSTYGIVELTIPGEHKARSPLATERAHHMAEPEL